MRVHRRPLPLALVVLCTVALPFAPPFAPLAAAEVPPLAPVTGWTAVGPEGGAVTALLAHPDEPLVVFAGTDGAGVFVSRDGGVAWSTLPESPSGFADLRELHLGAGGDLWAAELRGSIFRLPPADDSYDGPWTDVSIPEVLGLTPTLALDPDAPQVAYAGSFYGVHKTASSGAGWTALEGFPRDDDFPHDPAPPEPVSDLTFDAAGATLWAATGDGVYRSADGGETWQPASGGLAGAALEVDALAAVPGAPGRLFAATGAGIYTTGNGGDLWLPAGAGPAGTVLDLEVDPSDPDRLWARASNRLHTSGDNGATWQPVAGLPTSIRSFALGPAGSGAVYAGSALGAHRSVDGGQSWQLSNHGLLGVRIISLDGRPDTGGRLLAATGDGEILRSPDAGATWTQVFSGPRQVASSPADPAVAWAIEGGSVYRSVDGGLVWGLAATLQDVILYALWPDPRSAEVVYAAGFLSLPFSEDPLFLYRSADGGASWQTVWGGGITEAFNSLAFGSGTPRVLLGSSSTGGVYRSDDDGLTWVDVDPAGLGSGEAISELAADPRDPERFLGAVPGRGPVETTDAGDSWHSSGSGLPEGAAPRLLFDPAAAGTVYAAVSGEGGFRSTDDGATWRRIGDTPTDRLRGVLDLAVTGDPPRLYAGTDRGVWVAGPDTSPCVANGTTLCLNDGRFEARVQWQGFAGGSGPGHAVPLTGDTGAFWFFFADNLELAVKVLDGRGVNGWWWVFYGSLSNVAFTLTVRDTETGTVQLYENPLRRFASRGDTRAFPGIAPSGGAAASQPARAVAPHPAPGTGACQPDGITLCLQDGRFSARVDWQGPQGGAGAGQSHPLTDDTGAFWFFRDTNLELFVKVLDGRGVNGRWWVFYGSLSNVAFTLTVTDTETGTPKVYQSPPRTMASRGDTAAF